MKLTKQKLEQLILQEMEYYRPPQYDSKAEKEYPEHGDKLSKLYKTDPEQAKALAQALDDDPIDVSAPEMTQDPDLEVAGDLEYHGQFKKQSLTAEGALELQFIPSKNHWRMDYYYKTPTGSYMFSSSKEYPSYEEAKEVYNSIAINKI